MKCRLREKCSFQQMLVPFFFLCLYGPTSARSNEGMDASFVRTHKPEQLLPASSPLPPSPSHCQPNLVLALPHHGQALHSQSLQPHSFTKLDGSTWGSESHPSRKQLRQCMFGVTVFLLNFNSVPVGGPCRLPLPQSPLFCCLHLVWLHSVTAWLLKTFSFDIWYLPGFHAASLPHPDAFPTAIQTPWLWPVPWGTSWLCFLFLLVTCPNTAFPHPNISFVILCMHLGEGLQEASYLKLWFHSVWVDVVPPVLGGLIFMQVGVSSLQCF